jgi:hypothetical protein
MFFVMKTCANNTTLLDFQHTHRPIELILREVLADLRLRGLTNAPTPTINRPEALRITRVKVQIHLRIPTGSSRGPIGKDHSELTKSTTNFMKICEGTNSNRTKITEMQIKTVAAAKVRTRPEVFSRCI